MRHSVRKFLGAALVATAAVFVLTPAMAGAQTAGPIPGPGVGGCTFFLTPATVNTPTANNIAVHVSAPPHVHVEVFNPSPSVVASGDSGNSGNVTFTGLSIPPNEFSVSYTYNGNAYITGCATVSGEVVARVKVEVAGEQVVKAPLAFTGSNDTPTFVIIGAAAVVIGLVLVVAARRRSRVHG